MAVHGTAKCILWNSSFFNVSLNSKMESEETGGEMNDCRELLGSLGCKWGLFSPVTGSPYCAGTDILLKTLTITFLL